MFGLSGMARMTEKPRKIDLQQKIFKIEILNIFPLKMNFFRSFPDSSCVFVFVFFSDFIDWIVSFF